MERKRYTIDEWIAWFEAQDATLQKAIAATIRVMEAMGVPTEQAAHIALYTVEDAKVEALERQFRLEPPDSVN